MPRALLHDRERVIDLAWEGCLNVRDLGGLQAGSGRVVRLGALVRADNVRTLTAAGWDALVAYGIRRIVDLRLQHELDADAAGESPVEVVHISVLGDFDGDTLAFYDAKLDEATDAAAYLAWSYGDFLERYHRARNPQEEQRYLWGLGDFNDDRCALDAAEKCFSEFRNQDAAIVLGLLSRTPDSGPKVWTYFTSRWDEAVEKFPPSSLSRLGLGIPTFIGDEAFATKVEAFHAAHSLGGEQRTIDQQLERMRVGLTFAAAMRHQF